MRIIIASVLIIFSGCSGTNKPFLLTTGSNTLAGVQKLIDSFRNDYLKVSTVRYKDSIINQYNEKINHYLSDNKLDSVKVHVDTIISRGLEVFVKFRYNKDIALEYTLIFSPPISPFYDSVFHYVKSLRTGSDTMMSFTYMGSHQLEIEDQPYIPTLTIFAIPFISKSHQEK